MKKSIIIALGALMAGCHQAPVTQQQPPDPAEPLAVEAQEVVHVEAETGDGRAEFEGVVRTVPVIVVEEEREAF